MLGRPVRGLCERLPDARIHGSGDTVVTGITHDSRGVRPGDIYLARAGEHAHGIDYVGAAVAAGAVAVLTDAASVTAAVAAGVTVVEVADPRAAAGPAAAWVYGDPARDLDVIGVTGTNGKTTTAYLLDGGLRAAGRRTGLVGTVETRIADAVVPSARTTPEATDLQALFAVMRERGVDAVAMEVSSHALALERVAGTTFAVAAFTNLSQDHLDFHADMDDYFAAKARLFTPPYSARAVVAVDDEWGRRLVDTATIEVTSVGAAPADWTRVEESVTATGGRATLRAPDGGQHDVDVSLPGRFNVRNASVAYVALVLAGIEPAVAREGIASVTTIPGRMERIHAGQPFLALVDYAHTPAAVTTLLAEVRGLVGDGRVVVVLGCGGDRDRGKRPLMGAAAARGADVAVLTNDNPRSEDPRAILDAMVAGARDAGGTAEIVVEPDRRRAIALAVDRSAPGGALVVAGKGHEQGQEQGGVVTPFDDRIVLREALA
ncbi:MAG: UDP-N-acetylmuramoyl-L-alanyl-D-glutamate--2,6-diaminopimelate ligase [Frankiaceae bacterium]|jgi:UDP-N-acetylmuramoyl-L-alanyl-D-glutamate--2,6-diaminopimelate ligase|nr:UDP-N-acetylmuramoyl-L-alanyl-D-glutamate--2,6-diaminopimelate ligase [Frankiaceae bacterium]